MKNEKPFNLTEALDSMPNPPHTLEVTQYKRAIGDVVLTYKAKFRVTAPLADLGKEIAAVIVELQARAIQTKRFDLEWGHTKNFKVILLAREPVEATLIVELLTPDVIARKEQDDENAVVGITEFLEERRRQQKIAESIENDIAA